MNLNWKKIIGYGIVIWVAVFIFVTILVGFKAETEAFFWWLVTQIVVIITAVTLAKKLPLAKVQTALITGLIWVVVVFALDLLITARFTTMEFFNSWKIWISYVIILLVPVVMMKKSTLENKTPPAQVM